MLSIAATPTPTAAQSFITTFGKDLATLGARDVRVIDAMTVSAQFPTDKLGVARHVLADTVAGAQLLIPGAKNNGADWKAAANFLSPLGSEGLFAATQWAEDRTSPLTFTALVNEQKPQFAERLRALLRPEIAGMQTTVKLLPPPVEQ